MIQAYKKIKILYVITGLKTGGAEMLVCDMCRLLNTEDFEVRVVSLTGSGEVGRQMKEEKYNVETLSSGFKYNPFLFFKLRSVIKKYNPDIIHSHLFHADILSRFAVWFIKKPAIISTTHSNIFHGRVREMLLRYTDSLVNRTIAVSGEVARELVRKKITIQKKIQIIYNGVDLKKFNVASPEVSLRQREKLSIEKDKKIFISVGRLHKIKAQSLLVDAAYILKKQYGNFHIIIVGSGDEYGVLKDRIQRFGLESQVTLAGKKDNVQDFLQASDVFILTSKEEGFGLSVVEAMASGLPVIATKVGGVPEIIEDGETGFLIKSQNINELVDKMSFFMKLSDEKRRSIGVRARRVVEEKFSITKMMHSYTDLYKDILKQ